MKKQQQINDYRKPTKQQIARKKNNIKIKKAYRKAERELE